MSMLCWFKIFHLLSALFTMIESERRKKEPDITAVLKNQNTTFRNFLKILEENFRRPEGVADFPAARAARRCWRLPGADLWGSVGGRSCCLRSWAQCRPRNRANPPTHQVDQAPAGQDSEDFSAPRVPASAGCGRLRARPI